jgi:hypothetical protein
VTRHVDRCQKQEVDCAAGRIRDEVKNLRALAPVGVHSLQADSFRLRKSKGPELGEH